MVCGKPQVLIIGKIWPNPGHRKSPDTQKWFELSFLKNGTPSLIAYFQKPTLQ